jgi:hypothetical protein
VRPVSSGARSGASQHAKGGYAQADEVARRANVLNESETPENAASLNRLNRALSSDQPLRGDVPRGFYLNLRI